MSEDQANCPRCGQPLLGKDRFEGVCSVCRAQELLGDAPAATDAGGGVPEGIPCPACGATNPPGAARCAVCEARLRSGRRIGPWVGLIAVGCAAAVIGVVALTRGRGRAVARYPRVGGPPAPAPLAGPPRTAAPPPAAPAPPGPRHLALPPDVARETEELLKLLGAKDYERILDNYCPPEDPDFQRVQLALKHIVTGPGVAGFRRWSRLVIRHSPHEAAERLRRAGDPHPGYTVDFLAHLTRDPAASGARTSDEDRARNIIAWHMAGLFGDMELATARVHPVARRIGNAILVSLDCRGAPAALRPDDDPRRLRWRRLPVGMTLTFALPHHLDTIRRVLGQPIPEPNAPPPGREP